MAQTKKKVPYRIRFRGADYVRADVDPNSIYLSKAVKEYTSRRFKPLLTALDESVGLVGDIERALGLAYFRKTGIRDVLDLKEEGLLTKEELWDRIATFNEQLAIALGNVEVVHQYMSAAADIAVKYGLLDQKLFNANVEKQKIGAKDFRPVTTDDELEKSFREETNLEIARERLKKKDEEEEV